MCRFEQVDFMIDGQIERLVNYSIFFDGAFGHGFLGYARLWRAFSKTHHSIHHAGGVLTQSLSCTTPFPVLRFLAETGVNWIVFNVGKRIVKITLIADVTINLTA